MAVLSGLKPEKVFEYFEKLCSVPHGSGKSQSLMGQMLAQAQLEEEGKAE